MNLHNFKESFNELIELASIYYNVDEAYIEKDYYVSLILKEINSKFPYIVFKGGTSLSKCFEIIDRFSEDIDLTLEINHLTPKFKRELKQTIIDVCDKYNIMILNLDTIRSRRDFNRYDLSYNPKYESDAIIKKIIIETTYISKSYPIVEKETKNMIYCYLENFKRYDLIDKFDLKPFKLKVQSLERTFVDKIFAVCDCSLRSEIYRTSRHIYDLYKIFPLIKKDDFLRKLFNEVREERKLNKRCISAQDGFDIKDKLNDIVLNDIFKKDYELITFKMLFIKVSYELAIDVLNKICNEFLI